MEEIIKNEEFRFICNKCNYKCNQKASIDKHLKSELHKTGKRKVRSDYNGPYKCDICNYETSNNTAYKEHILNNHKTIEEREKEYKYYCNLCNYGSESEINIKKHNLSLKHQYFLLKIKKI